MNHLIITYTLYLLITIPLTIWVAQTLHRNGRIFLVKCFSEDEEMADSVNHLLVVGFYLVNIGFVALYLKLSQAVLTTQDVFEALAGKIGTVLLLLGIMHFFNIFLFTRTRKKHLLEAAAPPILPNGQTEL